MKEKKIVQRFPNDVRAVMDENGYISYEGQENCGHTINYPIHPFLPGGRNFVDPREIPIPADRSKDFYDPNFSVDPITMDNYNKRVSLKRETLLSPQHRLKMRILPY